MKQARGRAGFDLDLRYGKSREDALGALLRGSRLEVKSDKKCAETGNLFIEFRQHKRPSGIAITEAEFWAFEYLKNHWLIVPTERLREIARRRYIELDGNGKRKHVKEGVGDNDNDGVCIPLLDLVKPPF